jgi:hypothetical protein
MILKKIKLSELHEAAYNPRTIDEESLASLKKSMDEFGYIQPIIWNERSGNVVSGHQRLKIIKSEKPVPKDVEVIVVDMDDVKEKAAVISFNKISGEWNSEKLSDLLGQIQGLDDDFLGLTGFTNNEITNLLSTSVRAELPDLHYDGEVGQQTGIRPAMTFYFENQKDYDKAWALLKKPSGAEPDTNKLLEVIKDMKPYNAKTKPKTKK